ncbi:MAG: hypothetical protein ACLP53_02145 [Isosphaeraceae bacterium]
MPRSSAGAWANSSPVNQFPGRGAASSNNWAMRGMDCRELSAGMPHLERETSLDDVLATLELLARRFRAIIGVSSFFCEKRTDTDYS